MWLGISSVCLLVTRGVEANVAARIAATEFATWGRVRTAERVLKIAENAVPAATAFAIPKKAKIA